MVKASPIQGSFNAGEFTPYLDGQIDLQKRRSALRTCQNMIPLKQGALVRRGGTYFIKEIKDSSNRTALIDFQYNTDQIYKIEFGDQYMRFYKDNAIITEAAQNITGITKANPAVVTYSGADNYANGDEVYISSVGGMTEVNGKFYLVANVNTGSNTFELTDIDGNNIDSTSYTTYTSGGTVEEVYEISSPYEQANLFDADNVLQVHYFQSADVVYILSESYAPRALVRNADANWTLNTLTLEDGPYLQLNTTSTTLALSGTSGSVTVTASAVAGINNGSGFLSTDVGRIIRWKDPANNWTWLTITAHTNTTTVTATISGPNASAGTATTNWRLGAYSDTTGWPRTGTFFQDRFVMGGSTDYPDRLDISEKSVYSSTSIGFAPSNAAGTVADDNAISITLPSKQVNRIQWMASDVTGLIVGTSGQEWTIKGDSDGIIKPSAHPETPISTTKSAYIQPILAESGIIFVQAAKRRVHDMIYSFDIDRLKPRDVTILAEHITKTQILDIKYQQEPLNTIWSYRTDGTLIGMTYYPDQDVFGWHRHVIGGYSDAGKTTQAIVESMIVTPSTDGSRDEVTLIVKRYINGAVRRYIEYITRFYEDDIALEDAFHVDCGLTYDGSATATITGFDHLEGETLKVMIDGKSHPDLTVSGGAITLANNRTASVVQAGLGNIWAIETLDIEAGAVDGTAQGKPKRITDVSLKLLNTLGINYGPNASNYDEYDFNQGIDFDEIPELFTGNTPYFEWPNDYDSYGKMYFWHDGVFPACIQAIMPQVVTYDRG